MWRHCFWEHFQQRKQLVAEAVPEHISLLQHTYVTPLTPFNGYLGNGYCLVESNVCYSYHYTKNGPTEPIQCVLQTSDVYCP